MSNKLATRSLAPIKFTYIASNIILIAVAVIVFLSDISFWKSIHNYEKFIEHYVKIPFIAVFVGSIFLIGLGLFGITSTLFNLYRGAYMVCALISILFISIIIGWICLLTSLDSLAEQTFQVLNKTMYNYTGEKKEMDALQSQLHCCGAQNHTNWEEILKFIPTTCYKYKDNYDTNEYSIDQLYSEGCLSALTRFIIYNAALSIIASVIIEGFFVLSIVLSCILGRMIKEQDKLAFLKNDNEVVNYGVPTSSQAYASAPPFIVSYDSNLIEELNNSICISAEQNSAASRSNRRNVNSHIRKNNAVCHF